MYDIKDRIIEIIKVVGKYKLDSYEGVNLIEEDILDSFGIIGLITEINKEFKLNIEITQAPVATWKTVESISEYIEKIS